MQNETARTNFSGLDKKTPSQCLKEEDLKDMQKQLLKNQKEFIKRNSV